MTMADQRYTDYWQNRKAEQTAERQRLTQQAWNDLKQVVALLKRDFGATRVIVFGSLVKGCFRQDSDVDIAVEGLSAADYFSAVAAANQISRHWVDLKPLESLEPHFRERVLATGKVIDATD